MTTAFDMVTPEKIERRMTGWSTDEWMNTRANYAEYLAAMGPEADKTFRQFAYGIAAQNELYAAMQECK